MSKWLVLANATHARIYDITHQNVKPNVVKEFEHPEGRLKNGELVSDKPGDFRKDQGGVGKFTKDHSPHEMEIIYFTEKIAHFLEEARNKNLVQELVICIDARMYGFLEEHLSSHVKAMIKKYIHKNYLTLPNAEVEKVVEEIQHGAL